MIKTRVIKNRGIFYASLLGLLLIGTFAGCSGGGSPAGSSTSSVSTGTGSASSADLSSMGLAPDSSWHSSYEVGAHSGFDCSSCHASAARVAGDPAISKVNAREVANNEICSVCHQSNYANSVFPHSGHNIGTYCNSCHYSDSFKSHNRVNQTEWHNEISTSCATCHSDKTPSLHSSDGRVSNCENCHSYSNGWTGASGSGGTHSTANCSNCHIDRMPANHFGTTCENCHQYPRWNDTSNSFTHSGVSSGCASCHSGHFSGYQCEWCHTFGISWGYSHSRNSSQACNACHTNGNFDGDEGNEGGEDDDD